MREQLPVSHIAELEGLEEDYTRKATRRLAAAEGIDYVPIKKEDDSGLLDEATSHFRRRMADIIYRIRNKPGQHPLAVARETGLTQEQQKLASMRGGLVDLKVSQLARIAAAEGRDFKTMVLWAILSPEEYTKVVKCLSN